MTELDATTQPDDPRPAEAAETEDPPVSPPVLPPAEAPDVEPVPDLEPAPEPAPLGSPDTPTDDPAPDAAPETPDVEAVPEPETADEPPQRRTGGRGRAATEPRPRPSRRPSRAPQPNPISSRPSPRRPRTVGRYIADALRAAGVRYAFTVPGESFLGLLDAFEGAGIRVIATRHEGAAAFMAEAHGQLTGRPAIALGTRAVGGANLAIGIHTARQDSTPMFVAVGQVERALLGREAFQEIDQVATLGGLAKWAAEPRRGRRDRRHDGRGGPPGARWPAGPRPALAARGPPRRADARRRARPTAPARRPRAPATTRSARSSSSSHRPSARSSSPAAACCARGPRPSSLRFAELLQVPIIAAWRRADVISNDNPLYLGMAGFGAASSGPGPARRRRCAAGHRLAAERGDDLRLHDAARRPAVGARRPRPGRGGRLDATDDHRGDRRQGLPQGGQRAAPRQGRPGRGAGRHAPGEQPRGPRGVRGGLGRRRDAVGRAGRPSRPDDRDAPAGPARRRDPDHRRGQLRELGRSWLPLPSSRHVPRPDLGRDGLRPAGGHRGRRWSIATGRSSRSSATAASG